MFPAPNKEGLGEVKGQNLTDVVVHLVKDVIPRTVIEVFGILLRIDMHVFHGDDDARVVENIP
jgi:hypothetical protein